MARSDVLTTPLRSRSRAAVIAYVVIAYAATWAWLLPMVASGATAEPGSGWPTHIPSLVGPLVAAVAVTASTGRLRALASAVVKIRVPIRWWLMAVSPLGIGAIAVAGGVIATGSAPQPAGFGVFAGISALAGPVGVAAVLVVVVSTFRGFDAGTLVGWFLGLVSGSVVLGWLYNRTGSVALTAIWHGLFNVVSGTAAAAGVMAAVTSTAVMVLAVILIVAEVLAGRRGRPTVLGPPDGTTRP